jgi:Phage integrase, N-terminal SAM-like domain
VSLALSCAPWLRPRRSRHSPRPDQTALVAVETPPGGPLPARRDGYLRPDATLAEAVPVFLQWLRFIRKAAPNTVTAYALDLRMFLTFAEKAALRYPADVGVMHVETFLVPRARATSQRSDRQSPSLRPPGVLEVSAP